MLHASRARVVLAAVSLALLSLPKSAAAQTKPLTLDDVVDLVSSGVPQDRIVNRARANCLSFRVNDAAVSRLRAAGATSAVLSGLRSACSTVVEAKDRPAERVVPGRRINPPVVKPPPETVYVTRPANVNRPPTPVPTPTPSTTSTTTSWPAAQTGDELNIVSVLPTHAPTCRQLLRSAGSRGSGNAMAVGGFTAQRSGNVTINAAADNDPMLYLYGDQAGSWALLGQDDDSGEGNSSLLSAAVVGGSRYLMCVPAYSDTLAGRSTTWSGSYAGSTPPPVTPPSIASGSVPLTIGVTAYGRLEPGDQTMSDGSYKDYWSFPASAGERYRVRMQSTAFQSYFQLDGQSSTNGELEITIQTSGQHQIMANSSGSGAKPGAYTLTVEPAGGGGSPSAPVTGNTSSLASASALTIGVPGSGTLSGSDPLFSDGSHYDFWTFYANAGEQFTISMRSSGFDPYFSFGGGSGGSFSYESSSSRVGDVARLEVTIASSGTYAIRANSSGTGAKTGSYTLLVERGGGGGPPPSNVSALPGASSLTIGVPVGGTISVTDTPFGDGTYYDLWNFYARAGQRVRITMSSNDFSPCFGYGPATGSLQFKCGGGSVEMEIATSGTYTVKANTSASGGSKTGSYTVLVEELR